MLKLEYTTPVKWPKGRPSTPKGSHSASHGFKPNMPFKEAITFLEDELTALGATKGTLHTNISHISNDQARRNEKPDEPGASVSFTMAGKEYLIACDKWFQTQYNIYALQLAIRNIRMIEESGTMEKYNTLKAFESGYVTTRGVAENFSGNESWMNELGLGRAATLADANAIYRSRAKTAANDPQKLLKLNAAIDAARKTFENRGE